MRLAPAGGERPPSILGEILWALDDLAGGYLDVVILVLALLAVLICWFIPIAAALLASLPLTLLRAKARYGLAAALTVVLIFGWYRTWSALPNSPTQAVCYRVEMLREVNENRPMLYDPRLDIAIIDRGFYEIGGLVKCPVGYPSVWTFPQIRAAAWIERWYFSERMHWRSYLLEGDELTARWGAVLAPISAPDNHPDIPPWWDSGAEQFGWFLWYTFRVGVWILGIVGCFVDCLASIVVLNFIWPPLMYVLAWISPLPFAVVALWTPLGSAHLLTLAHAALAGRMRQMKSPSADPPPTAQTGES